MPTTHVVKVANELPMFTVAKNGEDRPVSIITSREADVFVHYIGEDRRMDEWRSKEDCKPIIAEKRKRGRPRRAVTEIPNDTQVFTSALTSRGRSVAPPVANGKAGVKEIVMSEEEYDLLQHKLPNKNFEKVYFGEWEVKTWYFSPYPLTDVEMDDLDAPPSTPQSQHMRIPGVSRSTGRSHGRTLDLLMGKLEKTRGNERAVLFVCEMCFKYMTDGGAYEAHIKCCTVKHPPGRIVYQKGRDTIWEVDGASNKVYCQNLALFGKLFIDHKTLYFDCENFSYYVLTDTKTTTDHIMGYFSKEKISYDDYNLACIVTLPPYQKQAYGMLMIEFSYELSRRAGKVGTPERPLSDLGLRSYLSYWVATLIRFLRRVLSVLPPGTPALTSTVGLPGFLECSEQTPEPNGNGEVSRKRKRTKGYNGEADPNAVPSPPTNGASSPQVHVSQSPNAVSVDGSVNPLFTTRRMVETLIRNDRSVELHVSVRCSLGDIAKATNLRVEDAAFALHECGLLRRKLSDEESGDRLLISGALVEKIAAERKVKEPCINLAHVKL